jgi:creatinine amidohydrolase
MRLEPNRAVRLYEMNWMQVAAYLEHDDRVVVPIGSTEQHAYLSLGTDAILAERVSLDAAEPLGVPVLPALPFGIAPYFATYPGSITLRVSSYLEVVRDILESLAGQGFRRIAVINGHSGNAPAASLIREWICQPRAPRVEVLFHTWCTGEKLVAAGSEFEPDQMHAGWVENYPWTRVKGAQIPSGAKPVLPRELAVNYTADEMRAAAGDGSMGGSYQRPEDELARVWAAAVAEVREVLEAGWLPG